MAPPMVIVLQELLVQQNMPLYYSPKKQARGYRSSDPLTACIIMEVFISVPPTACQAIEHITKVPCLTPPSCAHQEDNPTPTACQVLEQATRGMSIFPSNQPQLPYFQPSPTICLGTSTEPFSRRDHSPTTRHLIFTHRWEKFVWIQAQKSQTFIKVCSTHFCLLTYELTQTGAGCLTQLPTLGQSQTSSKALFVLPQLV